MNETPLLDQIRVYSEALVEDLPSQPIRIISAVAPSASQSPKHNRGWAVVAAVAAVTLILVGGVPWLARLRTSGSPVAATSLEINVEWVKVTEGNPPYAGPYDRTLGAPFVVDDGTTKRVAFVSGTDGTAYSLWTSEDGIDWVETVLSLPNQGRQGGTLEPTPTGYWYIGHDPQAQLWYSSDVVSGWEEINLDGLNRQTLYPLTGEPEIRGVAVLGDTTLIAVEYQMAFDWNELLGIEPGTYDYLDYEYDGDEEHAEDRQIEQLDPVVTLSGRVILEDEDRSETLLRFIPLMTADGLILAHPESGEALFEFPNHDAFDWADVVSHEARHRFRTELSTVLAVTHDGVKAIGPWSSDVGTLLSTESIELIESHEGIVVNVHDTEGPGESYVIRDGASFETISLPYPWVEYNEASGYFYTPYADPAFGFGRHWISSDGVNWTLLDALPELRVGQNVSTLSRVADGWLFLKYSGNSSPLSLFSLDGDEWRSVEIPAEVRTELSRTFGLPMAWGNRVLMLGQDAIWVGTVDIEDR